MLHFLPPHLSNAELRRLLWFLLQPDLETLVNDVERDSAEEEVGSAEGGEVHLDIVRVPGAVHAKLLRGARLHTRRERTISGQVTPHHNT
jgi:hypothetical protein